MDRTGADFFRVVTQIKEKLSATPIPDPDPIGGRGRILHGVSGFDCFKQSLCMGDDTLVNNIMKFPYLKI